MGAWASLILACHHTDELILLGDSKITIDWLNGLADFQVAALECWKKRTKEATLQFRKLIFTHIYREENCEADSLSKRALHLPPGQICFIIWEDGNEGPAIKLMLWMLSSVLLRNPFLWADYSCEWVLFVLVSHGPCQVSNFSSLVRQQADKTALYKFISLWI